MQWSDKVGWPISKMVDHVGISRSKYYQWQLRQGQSNQHNAPVPRRNWLKPEEKAAILAYHDQHRCEGYRRLSYMMIDADIVATSPSTVYRVLTAHDRLRRWNPAPSKKGDGFNQPKRPHAHWHIDIAYLNICGTFYYLCSVLDGFSRYLTHWEIREAMKEQDVEVIIQRAREAFPDAQPRIITDNGPQFVARDFKQFVRETGLQHVRTSPYYPQSNGKIERWHRTLKQDAIRPKTPLSLEDARQLVGDFVDHYNTERLHSAIGYITPADKLAGKAEAIKSQRQQKLETAKKNRNEYWASKPLNVKEH